MNSNGFFNYMSENSHNSLFRNGKVLTKRDINGSDAGSLGIDLKKVEMPVINARDQLGKKKIYLDKNEFRLEISITFCEIFQKSLNRGVLRKN